MAFWKSHKQQDSIPAAESLKRTSTQQYKLDNARQLFNELETRLQPKAYKNREHESWVKLRRSLAFRLIPSHLKEADATYADLDPTGQRDGKEMEQVIRDARYNHYVAEARESFARLQHGSKASAINLKPEFFLRQIEDNLQQAGADYSALDPEGRITAREMKYQVLPQTVKNAHLSLAREKFATLDKGIELISALAAGMVGGKQTPEKLAGEIRDHVKKAGAGLSALDPEGRKNDKEMARQLDEMVAKHQYRTEDPQKFRDQVKVLTTMPKSGGRGR